MPFVLKDGETFAIFDASGDIPGGSADELGVFHEGMRHLSCLELLMWGKRPLLLSSSVREDNCLLTAHLTNPDLGGEGEPAIENGIIYVQRSTVLTSTSCSQRLRLTSFADQFLEVPLLLHFGTDFHDIFEVRGIERKRRGVQRPVARTSDGLRFRYDGLDGHSRSVYVRVGPAEVQHIEDDSPAIAVRVHIGQHDTAELFVSVSFKTRDAPPGTEQRFQQAPHELDDDNASRAQGNPGTRGVSNVQSHPDPRASVATRDESAPDDGSPARMYAAARQHAIDRFSAACCDAATIHTNNELFNNWINRSFADIHLLATPTEFGQYPYAGVPWYSCPFGRDGLITARELLTIEPNLLRGVLGFLAQTQATDEDDSHDADPGKIVHEMRLGEMAAIGEVPFARYYGTADATPLFVMFAGDYLDRTGDTDFIRCMWPNIEAALNWIDQYGDEDGDGYVEYERHSPDGLVNQGWKDSHDSIFYADGSDPEGAIALCEVQGYVYAAKRAAAAMARALEKRDLARTLLEQAARLRLRFQKDFWCRDLQTYALALDGRKRPCRVIASNAGHALFTEIASEEHARRVVESLMSEGSFCGWGIRTLDQSAARFNPMSYHNGSVWPHDNALIALGFAKYQHKEEVLRIIDGLFDTSLFMPMHRLPELFCGFARQHGEGPTMYPVACLPQAWASGTVFALLEACLGLSISFNAAGRPQVLLDHPVLPPFIDEIEIRNLSIGGETIDMVWHRYENDVAASVIRRPPNVEVIVRK